MALPRSHSPPPHLGGGPWPTPRDSAAPALRLFSLAPRSDARRPLPSFSVLHVGSSPHRRYATCADALVLIDWEHRRHMSSPAQILLVAHHTAATPRLVEQVRTRARHGSCSIVLLVPGPCKDPETEEAAKVIELALPLVEEAGGSLGSQQSSATATRSSPVLDALERSDFDEVIISTLPQRVSRWPRQDLPARVERQGLPVVVVTASQSDRAWGS